MSAGAKHDPKALAATTRELRMELLLPLPTEGAGGCEKSHLSGVFLPTDADLRPPLKGELGVRIVDADDEDL